LESRFPKHENVGQLLDLILRKAREITAADAGSLYLVEKDSEPANRALRAPRLRFKLIQNDSVQFPFSERTLPLTEESIAGYCALHAGAIELADAYRIPKARHFISIHRSIRGRVIAHAR